MQGTRRQFVGGLAALAGGAVAGCIDGIDPESVGAENDGAYASFFTLEDFTERVVGDEMTVTNPIPAGEMGHQYEVGSDAQVDAARSQAFVYLDVEGFQRWALDVATNLREDHPEVTPVDALADVDLLDFEGEGHAGEEQEDGHDDHDHDEEEHDHDEEEHDHDEEEHDHDEEEHNHDHEGGHGGDFDPHFWLDPLRAVRSVETIADGLAEVDADNAEAYADNAEAYAAELEALDETFRSELDGRDLETVVVAGHNSFQYLQERYGFEVHSPVGVSPDAEPSSSEIAETVELVDETGIDVVLYNTFESSRLAETIVSESDASETMEFSSAEGTTAEWDEKGWGYLEQMKEINLPALKAALNVT